MLCLSLVYFRVDSGKMTKEKVQVQCQESERLGNMEETRFESAEDAAVGEFVGYAC